VVAHRRCADHQTAAIITIKHLPMVNSLARTLYLCYVDAIEKKKKKTKKKKKKNEE